MIVRPSCPKTRPHKSPFRSCTPPDPGAASEKLQDGAMPLIDGLDEAKLPNTRRVRSCLEWLSVGANMPKRSSTFSSGVPRGLVPKNAVVFTDFQWVTFHLDESRLLGQMASCCSRKTGYTSLRTYQEPARTEVEAGEDIAAEASIFKPSRCVVNVMVSSALRFDSVPANGVGLAWPSGGDEFGDGLITT